MLQAYRSGKHVTVFGNMTDALTGGTLYVGQIRTEVPVRAWGPPLLAGTLAAAWFSTTAIVPVVPVTPTTTNGGAIPRCTGVVLAPEAISRGGDWEPLN